jgi:hypothetical protein
LRSDGPSLQCALDSSALRPPARPDARSRSVIRLAASHSRLLALAAVSLVAWSSATARAETLFASVYTVDDGVQPSTAFLGTNDLRDLGDLFDSERLAALFPEKNWTNPNALAVSSALNLRGVSIQAGFQANSTDLQVQIPLLGIDFTITGGSREEATEQLEQLLRGLTTIAVTADDGAILTSLLQKLVRQSAVDPVAGNPNSLQTRMFATSYRMGTDAHFRPEDDTPAAALWTGDDLFRTTASVQHFEGGPWSGQVFDLGFDYTVNFRNPRWAILVDLPLTVTSTESANSILASLGLGVQWRPTSWWNLTPELRVGGVGSIQMGAVAILANVTVTSAMRFPIRPFVLGRGGDGIEIRNLEVGLGNMVGWSGTFDDLSLGGYRIAYRLDNYPIRNGVDLTKRFGGRFLGGAPMVRLSFVDTWILGSALFLDHYDEVGLEVGTRKMTGGTWRDALSLKLSYAFGDSYDAVRLDASVRF